MDVTNTNNGKITWKILKPIIQGKIIYGPVSDTTKEIVSFSNKTFDEMHRLREFFGSLEMSVKMLKTDKEFRGNFDNLLNLAKSPFVQAILGGTVDIATIESVLKSIMNDPRVLEVIEIIGKILECFSVDRFVPVHDEKELEEVAHELAKQKLFYAAFFFTDTSNQTSYKLRMEVDNTPVTVENKNRFWFPGPEGNFELEMRYHRGFIEIQNSIDTGIIKYQKKKQFEASNKSESSDDLDFSDLAFEDNRKEEPKDTSYENDDGEDFGGLKLDTNGDFGEANKTTTPAATTSQGPAINFGDVFKAFQGKVNISDTAVDKFSDDSDFWKFDDEETTKTESTTPATTEQTSDDSSTLPPLSRSKRQFESILNMFGFGGSSEKQQATPKKVSFEVDGLTFHTKQFPYTKHTQDDFKKGLYLAQAVQMSFFFALIIHISSSVRQKIWFKESGNLSVSSSGL